MANQLSKIGKIRDALDELESALSGSDDDKVKENISRMAEKGKDMIDETGKKAKDLVDKGEKAAHNVAQKVKDSPLFTEEAKKVWVAIGGIVGILAIIGIIKKIKCASQDK